MSARLALLCPGQGGQGPGMFRLVEEEPAAATVLGALRRVCGANVGREEAGMFVNAVAQPLVVACTLAHWAALRSRGLAQPALVAGYSVGELAAHGCAGTFDVVAAVDLARARALAMDAASPAGGAGLLAVRGLADAALDAVCGETGLALAIDNGPGHRVLGGLAAALELGERLARERGAAVARRLNVEVPAHTPGLRAAGEDFQKTLLRADLHAPRMSVLAGIDAAPVRDHARAVETLAAQISRPIRWAACLRAAWELGARVFLELPPGDALARIAREVLPAGAEVRAVSEFRTLPGVLAWVGRVSGE